MLIFDTIQIGNKLLALRKRAGLTQAELAEAAGLSDERGTVNMKTETVLRICNALKITPNEILTDETSPLTLRREELFDKLSSCKPAQQATALDILSAYLRSLDK